MARTSNPAFQDSTWDRVARASSGTPTATVQGTVDKTMILLAVLLVTAIGTWISAAPLLASGLMFPIVLGSAVVQLGMTFYLVRNPEAARTVALLYAAIEGVTVGLISVVSEMAFPGVVLQATMGTAGVIFGMVAIYKARLIAVTDNLKIMVGAATIGIALTYLLSLVGQLAFGMSIPMIHQGGPVGILFSLFVIGVAAFNLAIDFDFIENAEARRAPAWMEWYGAFGLLVTIVWLYIEMLRLMRKLQDR